ncbi:hypothetical protein P9239_19005 [Caballeronia sp. LZ062]|uniref:hypothetical protein n=1 Tax=unclassified Caballeronia TaxID=2646786 RepID=UPI0028591716|nr:MULTISPECIES: hypothetical protein [unclassified Caballeronia]MDR5855773.1 hypothetical protein [Caballeronia sp. LZ050]MDR5872440.1 hypothetical protein [Caballeronia sp. LZ062]
MLEPSGTVKLLVVETETGEEEEVVLTEKDFHPERRSMLDDEALRDDDEGEYVAYASGLGFDFKVVATPPRQIDIEDEPEEIRIEIIENDLDFEEPQDDRGEAEG